MSDIPGSEGRDDGYSPTAPVGVSPMISPRGLPSPRAHPGQDRHSSPFLRQFTNKLAEVDDLVAKEVQRLQEQLITVRDESRLSCSRSLHDLHGPDSRDFPAVPDEWMRADEKETTRYVLGGVMDGETEDTASEQPQTLAHTKSYFGSACSDGQIGSGFFAMPRYTSQASQRSMTGGKGHFYLLHSGWQEQVTSSTIMPFSSSTTTTDLHNWSEHSDRDKGLFHPMSFFCVWWEAVLVCVIVYDFVMVPIDVAFGPVQDEVTEAMSWFVRCCWSISIPLNCNTGYVMPDGGVLMKRRKIAMHYLRTWAIFDTIIVLSEWSSLLLDTFDFWSSVRSVKLLRAFRAVRVLRLLRVLRAPAMLQRINKRANFERAEFAVVFLKVAAGMLAVAHIMACVWYVIGLADSGWVEGYGYNGKPVIVKYTVSLQWALTQFIGNIDVNAQTYAERSFSVFALGTCFFVSACCLSEITASLTRLSIVSGRIGRQFALLRQYLDYQAISPGLRIRVIKAAQTQVDEKQRNMPEREVELLEMLSEPLMAEIHYEVNISAFARHGFFQRYHRVCPLAMRMLCHTAMTQQSLEALDLVFIEGERQTVSKMYLVRHGRLAYTKSFQDYVVNLSTGAYVSEMALWTTWVHRGDLRAMTTSSIFILDAKTFIEIAKRFSHYAATYAHEVVRYLNMWTSGTTSLQAHDHHHDEHAVDDVSYGSMPVQDILRQVFPMCPGEISGATVSGGEDSSWNPASSLTRWVPWYRAQS